MNSDKFIALGVAGALIYVATAVAKKPPVRTALLAVGAVIAARQVPVLNQYV